MYALLKVSKSSASYASFCVLFLFGISFVGPASAGPFLDLGIGAAIDVNESRGRNCIRDWNESAQNWGCSSNPLGYIGIGYDYRNLTISVEHWSSIMTYDAGLNLVAVKYRYGKD